MARPTTKRVHALQGSVRAHRKAWIITGLLVVFQIVAFADKAVLGLVAPKAIPELGMSAVQFGFIGSAFFFLYALVSILAGFLASRVSVRWILLVLGVVWAVTQFPMLFGGGAAVLLVSRIVLGGAEGPATAMSLTAAHSWFEPRRRALPSNLVAMGSTLGPVIAAPALTWVIVAWGWRWAFGVLGVVGFMWVVVWLFISSDGPYAGHGRAGSSRSAVPMNAKTTTLGDVDTQHPVIIRRALLSGTFLAAVVGGASSFWVQGFVTTWLPQYLNTVVGLPLPTVGVVTTVPWFLGALILLGSGILGHRMLQRGRTAHRSIAVPFGVAIAVSGVSFLLIPLTDGALAVSLLCLAAGSSLVYPMAASAVAYAVGAKQRPILMATLGGVASVGAVISPTFVGWLMNRAGYITSAPGVQLDPTMADHMAQGVHQAFTVTGFFLLAGGSACILFLRPERLARKLQQSHRAR